MFFENGTICFAVCSVLQARRNRDLFCLFVYKYFGSKEMMMKIPA